MGTTVCVSSRFSNLKKKIIMDNKDNENRNNKKTKQFEHKSSDWLTPRKKIFKSELTEIAREVSKPTADVLKAKAFFRSFCTCIRSSHFSELVDESKNDVN